MGLVEIGGYYGALKRGFAALGIPATFLIMNEQNNPFRYEGSDHPLLLRLYQRVFAWRYVPYFNRRLGYRLVNALAQAIKIALFIWLLLRHDVFIYGWTSSFFPSRIDWRILRLFRKRIIFVFHGSDSRPPFLNGVFLVGNAPTGEKPLSTAECAQLARKKKNLVLEVRRVADVVVDSASSGHFHESPFILWTKIGIPCEPITAVAPDLGQRDKIRILHAPSRGETKGTPHIRQAVEALAARGHDLELIEISGQPNSVVKEELTLCDFVVDEIYSDMLMAGLGSEAACYGKPTLNGGYALKLWQKLTPEKERPSGLYCHPDELFQSLEKMAVDHEYRGRLGGEALRFVSDFWSARAVCQRFLRLIKGDIPDDWWYDPRDSDYFHGWGVPESRLKEFLRDYVETLGPEALCLEDKPDVKAALVQFAFEINKDGESGMGQRN